MKQRTVQVDYKVWIDMYVLITDMVNGIDLDTAYTERRIKNIHQHLEEKMQGMIKREVFTQYKTSEPSSHQREALRQKYLELAGIQRDWQSSIETIP